MGAFVVAVAVVGIVVEAVAIEGVGGRIAVVVACTKEVELVAGEEVD